MAPSVAALSAAILAYAGSAVATQFSLAETYDASNFFDKFNFFTDGDPNAGFVVYQSREQAQAQGLAQIRNNEVYLGVDHTTTLQGPGFPGRNSLRLESRASYKHGLIVARFTHLPANRCGTWPSFWTLGNSWPGDGEIDLYEGWNDYVHNAPALHAGNSTLYGACRLDGANQTSPVATPNCDNTFQNPPQQYLNQGCTAAEYNSPWASSNGGTYAIEWTSQYIKLYNFFRGREPANLGSNNPDTSTWGTPSVFLKGSECDIDRHFQNQRLILDITFCGNPAGTDDFWKQACASKTGQNYCANYVAQFPNDFAESYFQIQDIRYFTEQARQVDNEKRYDQEEPVEPVVTEPAPITYASSGTGAPAPVITTSRWTNTTVAAAPTSVDYTTSTVYTTSVHTVTKCPAYVVDCPAGGYVTTETIPLYTTVCPVTATGVPVPQPTATEGAPDETITTKITKTYTITSCAPIVTDCPVGSTTIEVITTTYCPGEATGVPSYSDAPAPEEPAPVESAPTTIIYQTATVVPQPIPEPNAPSNGTYNPQPSSGISTPGNPESPVPTGQTPGEGCTGANCPPVVGGSVRAGVSTIALVSALVAMLL